MDSEGYKVSKEHDTNMGKILGCACEKLEEE